MSSTVRPILFKGYPGADGKPRGSLKVFAHGACRFASVGTTIEDPAELESIGAEKIERLVAQGSAIYLDGSPAAAEVPTEVVLGFDSAGHEVKLSDFISESWKIFARLTHPGPEGEALIRALCLAPNIDEMAQADALGIDFAAVARASLAQGRDPVEGLKAEIGWRQAINEARSAAGGRPKYFRSEEAAQK